jgi:serine/threonine-protein kinase
LCPACLLGVLLDDGPGPASDGGSLEEVAYRDHALAVIGRFDEGGVGVVYEAEEVGLGRVVALKVLREEHRDDDTLRRRFEEEARIGARLQHPGIVPVYQSGMLGDRPFFTMRRVEGRSLAAVLAERPPLPRSLGVFLQVCQALAYAHDLGVIHRDLKPSNVMVGDFGEVVLLDWGMARERDRAPAGASPRVEIATSDGSIKPGSGPVMGTPAYMAPEQARGEADRLDERCDVFGLGAILCEILTGRPPYTGQPESEVRRKAREADLGEALARIDAAEADPELRALARACLDPDPARRPANAGGVAAAIAAYQAGVDERLKAAEQARWKAEGRAAEARKRLWVTLALMAVCAGVGIWYFADRAERARKDREREQVIDRMLEEAGRLRVSGRSAEARAVSRAVEGLLPEAGDGLRRRAAARVADLQTLAQLEEARSAPARAGDPRVPGQRATAYAEAFRRYEVDPTRADVAEAAGRIRGQPIREALVVALDDWARAVRDPEQRRRLREVAAAADPRPEGLEGRLRKALSARDRAALVALAGSPDLADQPAAVLVALGSTLREAGARAEAAAVLRRAQELNPSDFWVNLELAAALAVLGPAEAAGAEAYRTASLALSRRNPLVYLYLGQALHDAGRPAEAAEAYRQALAIQPEYPEALNNLGNSLTALRRLDEAVAAFRKAIALREDYALAYFNLGYALDEQEKFDEAAESYRRAVASRPDYAEAYCNLGLAEYRLGSFAKAVADLDRGLALLPPGDPLRPSFERVVGMGRSLAELDPKLEAALAGKAKPSDVAETVGFARLCAWRNRQLHAHAARYYLDAFAAEPALADDLVVGDRYAAAGSAAMAGCGRGADAAGLSPDERADLRRRALGWLRADLDLRAKAIAGDDPAARDDARNRLRYWLRDPNLEGVRAPDALAALPDDERAGWEALWSDHARLIAPTPSQTGP